MLAISLSWPSISAAQTKSDQAKVSNPHAGHQEKQAAGGEDKGGQMKGMKMPGMSGQKQESAWWFDKYSRRQKPDMSGMDMSDGEGDMAGMTGMQDVKMDADSTAGDGSSSGMGMMDDVDLMGMMEVDLDMMGAIAGDVAESSSIKGMGEMKLASSLPGSPGVSRLYHVGATEFFLNYPEHITVTTKQLAALNRLKQKALFSKATTQRKIDEAEQELWELTGADEPNAAQILDKVQAIEKLRGEQRMAFIQSVADAAIVLTDEQRQMLIGTRADETAKTDAHENKIGTKSGTPDTGGAAGEHDQTLNPAKQ